MKTNRIFLQIINLDDDDRFEISVKINILKKVKKNSVQYGE